jgi:hypothetical protein
MERQIVGILVELESNGNVDIRVDYLDILKETEKMFYPSFKPNQRVDRRAFRYLSQFRKAELGMIERRFNAGDTFSVQTHSVFSSKEEVEDAVRKLEIIAKAELDNRIERVNKWKKNFEEKRGQAL